MNITEMFNAINKGVPNYIPIEINIKTLIEQCASDSEQLRDEFTLVSQLYKEHIIKTNDFTKANEDFLVSLRTKTNYQNAQTDLFISPTNYLQRLKQILNISNPSIDFNDLELRKELLDSLEELKKITTSEELEVKYPEIHKDYLLSLDAYARINRFAEKHKGSSNPQVKATLERQRRLYNTYALDTRFNVFIEKQSLMYRNMIVRRQFIERYSNDHKIDLTMFTGLDKEKFELYLADKYLTIAIQAEDDKTKQECVYYLSTYIRETQFTPIAIKNDNGEEITFRKILFRFKKLLKQNPILKPIDEDRSHFEGYHWKHVENHVKKYFLSGVNWQIVPPGEETELNKRVIASLNRTYNHLSIEEKEKRIRERYAEYERKMRFFENSGYMHRVFGINEFNGYIAFIYPNGEVIMEKFFNDYAKCIPTINEAIYNVKVADFETLSKLKKPALIKDKRCHRIIHKGNWEIKGQEIIDRPATRESEEEAKKLILRLQGK